MFEIIKTVGLLKWFMAYIVILILRCHLGDKNRKDSN